MDSDPVRRLEGTADCNIFPCLTWVNLNFSILLGKSTVLLSTFRFQYVGLIKSVVALKIVFFFFENFKIPKIRVLVWLL